jgi:hypothetical protein
MIAHAIALPGIIPIRATSAKARFLLGFAGAAKRPPRRK